MASKRAFVEVAPNAAYLNAEVVQDDVVLRAEDASQTLYVGTGSNLPLRIVGGNVRVVGTLTADAYSNLPAGGATYNDTAVVAQATYGSNTAWAASNLVFGSVSNMATFSSNLSAANSNYVYGPLLASAVSTSNLAQNSAAYIVGPLATQLTGLEARSTYGSNQTVANAASIATNTAQLAVTSNAAFYASNVAAAAGGASGFAVNSNAVTYTSCNVGVKVSQPSYDFTVGGTAGMTRLVIERSVDALSAGGVLAGPQFMSYASTNTYYSTGAYQPITWETRTQDSGSNWVTVGQSNITVPMTGFYNVFASASSLDTSGFVSLRYGSGTVTPSNFVVLNDVNSPDGPEIIYATAGSVFSLATGTTNTSANVRKPRIVMHKVG
jgi:hypothetical protein